MFKEPSEYINICKMRPASATVELRGIYREAVDFITKEQLLDRGMWDDVINQFVTKPDTWQWRSEFWGKLMRGGSMIYEYTQSAELYTVLEYAVHELLRVQHDGGPLTTYKDEFNGWDIWGRKYVLLGMQYFYRICKNDILRDELLVAMRLEADCIIEHIGDGEGKKPLLKCSNNWGGMNSASVLEPFVCLYMLTHEERYLSFADYIVAGGGIEGFDILKAAYEDKLCPYQYKEQKAYEMMSCFEGLLDYYLVRGQEEHLLAVLRFADAVIRSDITVIGSAGTTHELFDHSVLHQCDPAYDGIMQETCVTVTWMKLCARLLTLTGNGKYCDEIERSAYNALLGAINFDKEPFMGRFYPIDSYSPLCEGMRWRKMGGEMVLNENRTMGCCIAISSAGIALVPLMTATMRGDDISFNLYSPCRISCACGSFEVDTDYPYGGEVNITLAEGGGDFSLYLHIPAWSKNTSLSVNGVTVPVQAENGYVKLTRKWVAGDRITLVFDMSLRALTSEQVGGKSGYISLSRGCVCLAREGDSIIPYSSAGRSHKKFAAWFPQQNKFEI